MASWGLARPPLIEQPPGDAGMSYLPPLQERTMQSSPAPLQSNPGKKGEKEQNPSRLAQITSWRPMAPGSQPHPASLLPGLDPDCLIHILKFLDVESLLRFQVAIPQLLQSAGARVSGWSCRESGVCLCRQAQCICIRHAPVTPPLCLALFCLAAVAIKCICEQCQQVGYIFLC